MTGPTSGKVVYDGRDLEAMSFAVNYHRWIFDVFRPLLGERLVEVGAGTGSFTRLLLEHPARSLAAVEPSAEMYAALVAMVGRCPAVAARVETYHALFSEVADEIGRRDRPDSIIYVNVLEHIRDDEAELALAARTLAPGGRAFIFVPALPALYGGFDRRVRHFRRYFKSELEQKCRRAGFRILRSSYLDMLGVVPWCLRYRLLGSDTLDAAAVKLYDTYVVPLTKALERAVRPPIGKNVILVAEKS